MRRLLAVAVGLLAHLAVAEVPFDDRDLEAVAALGDQASIAIGTLRRREEIEALNSRLQEKVAVKLTSLMFRMLRPGGKVLLTNFLPTVVDAGYMESFMGWDLIYRTREDLRDLARDIDPELSPKTGTIRDHLPKELP